MRKNIKIFVNYFLGPLLFFILAYSLYNQIVQQDDLHIRWQEIQYSWHQPAFWLVFLLMFLNYSIEAIKWRMLLAPLQKISFIRALKSVFAGCSITMLTPNRIGEYGGRIMYVDEKNRISAIPLTILGSIAQLIITIVLGTIGLGYFKYISANQGVLFDSIPDMAGNILLYISMITSCILLIVYFEAGLFVKLLHRSGISKGFVKYLIRLQQFRRKELLRILFLSFLRYIIFILQYILLMNVLQVHIPVSTCFWLLTIFYLLMALAHTIGFSELPVRAAASVELLKIYSPNILGIQAASFGIWMINLVVPAVIGSVLIFGIKLIKDKNENIN